MRSLRANSIGGKILIRSIAVALVPLIILASVVFLGLTQLGNDATERVDDSRAALESDSVLVTSQDQAVSVAREINLVLVERISDVRDWARNQEVIDGAFEAGIFSRDEGLTELPIDELEARFDSSKSTQQAISARAYLRAELSNNDSFGEIFFTDANGFNAALTSETSDFVQSDEDWWQTAWTEGINVDDIEFDESAGEFSVDIAVRIDDARTGLRLGVLKTTLDARFVDRIVNDRSSSTTDYTVALSDGRLISETGNADTSRLMSPSTTLENGIITALASPEAGGVVDGETVYGYTRTLDPEFFNIESSGFGGFDWVVVSSQSVETAFAPLEGLEELRADIEQSESNLRTIILVVLAVALLLAFVMARFMARAITGPILKLREAASQSAETGLPAAVGRINEEGADIESVTVDEVKIDTGDELEELAASFNSVQHTAVNLAAKQALSRRNTAEMFVNLGRRNQSLLKRQLRFIDDLEKNEADPDTLESLFKLDHLATRMRRNAESLLVLAGDRSPRRWAAPVPIRDGIQAALAEVEGYERVDFARIAEGEVQGNVAADVAHILAELIENALNFSPPQSQVTVMGREEEDGYSITISDEGLGMSAEDLESANDRLATVRELSEVPSQYLGLFVVGRLADRHNISVALSSASTGGLAARVLLPKALTESAPVEVLEQPVLGANLPDPREHVPNEDPEIAQAEAEVFALLAQAEEALSRIEEAKKRGSNADGQDTQSDVATATPDVSSPAAPAAEVPKRAENEVHPTSTPSPDTEPLPQMPMNPIDKMPTEVLGRRSEDQLGATPVASSDTPISPAEAVDVGGFSFPRRGVPAPEETSQARRADDAPEVATDASAPNLDQYGFTRRASVESSNDADPAFPETGSTDGPAEPLTEEDAMVTAEHSRNRWSRFQRGKEDAQVVEPHNEPTPTDVKTQDTTTSQTES